MTVTALPIDPRNPGQVFAALGLLELLDRIAPAAAPMGAFTADGPPRFLIEHAGNAHPVRLALDALRAARLTTAEPVRDEAKAPLDLLLPDGVSLRLDLWSDLDSRARVKTWAGQQTSHGITATLLEALRGRAFAPDAGAEAAPFDVGLPMTGRFGFDPRSAWTALDAGYSPNEQGEAVRTYPAVELLAAIGLQEGRPACLPGGGGHRYTLWTDPLPAPIAHAAMAGALGTGAPTYRFDLARRGSYLFFEPAREDTPP